MIIKGTVENGGIRVLSGIEQLPEGTEVFITPVVSAPDITLEADNFRRFKEQILQIAALPSEGKGDIFSGADHDQLLYGSD